MRLRLFACIASFAVHLGAGTTAQAQAPTRSALPQSTAVVVLTPEQELQVLLVVLDIAQYLVESQGIEFTTELDAVVFLLIIYAGVFEVYINLHFPRPTPPGGGGGGGVGGGGGGGGGGAPAGDWSCGSCGNTNFARRTHCNRCQAARPVDGGGGGEAGGWRG